MEFRRKHIPTIIILLLAAGMALAAASGSKIQNIRKESTVTIPVLLVEFSDTKFTLENPEEKFRTQMEKAAGYFNANWQEAKTFFFPIVATISLDTPIATYGAPSASFNDTDIRQLVADACTQAIEQGTDFSLYDTQGNGTISNIAIIFAGYSESEGGSPNSIWPHQQNLTGQEIEFGELKILSYTCTPELTGNSGSTISPIGTFCHEICHWLGLPDMYDTNSEDEGLSPALNGTLSIMDKGNHSDNGNTPPLFTSIEREILGIGEVEEILPNKEYTLLPVNLSGRIYRIKSSVEGEYFLVECRESAGWDKFVGGSGLVVYHIDKSKNIYGGISAAQRWEFNNINSFAEHSCARVLCAFDNNITTLSFNGGDGLLKDWNGNPVGVSLHNIRFSGGKVTFSSAEDYSYDGSLPAALECKVQPFQNDAMIGWNGADTGEDGKWMVKWAKKGDSTSVQTTTAAPYVKISSLDPDSQYNMHIRYVEDMVVGKAVSSKFRTYPVTSSFPYIFVDKDGYRKSEPAQLRIFNLVEQHKSIEWYADGELLEGDTFVPQQEGDVILEAVIYYYDGSEEKIYKRISVE